MKYLDDCIEYFDIRPKYNTAIESCTYDEGRRCWCGMARDMKMSMVFRYVARFLVVASGENSAENIPVIPGLHGFAGEIIHS